MPITNTTHTNMGGVWGASSTHNAGKTSAGSPYKESFKLLASPFKKSLCDAINRFGTEKLSETWGAFRSANKGQAQELARNLIHVFVDDMFDRAENAFSKQWKKKM